MGLFNKLGKALVGLNDIAEEKTNDNIAKAIRELRRESIDRLQLIAKSESDLGFKGYEVQAARFILVKELGRSTVFGGDKDGDFMRFDTNKFSVED